MESNTTSAMGSSHLYYGPGKGKTTAAMGLAMRAAGRNYSVTILQFMKGHEEVGQRYGELDVLRDRDAVEVRQFPTRHATCADDFDDSERETLREGVECAQRVIETAEFDLVVLDELTLLSSFDVVDPSVIVDLFETRPDGVELVVTGRNAPATVVDAAEYVTYMAAVKHPYRQGTTARAGIEF